MSPIEKSQRVRKGVYTFIIFIAAAIWWPYAAPVINAWREARRVRGTIALIYTTDTRGFLESCG